MDRGRESPLGTDPPANGATVSGGMCLSILGGDGGGGHSPVNVGGGAGTVLQLIGAGDPFDLAGLQVRAGGEGEAHRVSFGTERIVARIRGDQPSQSLAAVSARTTLCRRQA